MKLKIVERRDKLPEVQNMKSGSSKRMNGW